MAKPESERPAGCRFWLASDVVQWIVDHSYNAGVWNNDSDPEEAARWWKANLDADSMSDLNRRVWAEMCLNGLKATELDDVTEELQMSYEDRGEEGGITDQFIRGNDKMVEQQLREFFNVTK